jgi:hypothetical protein
MPDEIPQRDVTVDVTCPYCSGSVHSYPVTVSYSHVYFFETPSSWPETSEPFTRIFTCPETGQDFEAEITVPQEKGEIVDGVV